MIKIITILSNQYQVRYINKLVNEIKHHEIQLFIFGLRKNVISQDIWDKNIKIKKIYIDLSDQFDLSKLSFLDSLLQVQNLRSIIFKKISDENIKIGDEAIFLIEDMYRLHELSVISFFNPSPSIIVLQHGLRPMKRSTFLKGIINFARISLFCNLFRFGKASLKLLSNSNITNLYTADVKKPQLENGSYKVANYHLLSTLIEIQALEIPINKNNILFLGDGSLRIKNLHSSALVRNAINFATDFAQREGKKIFFKFKPGEVIEDLNLEDRTNNLIVIDEEKDLLVALKESNPCLVFCSQSSTTSVELLLSDYCVVLYESFFPGYDDFYGDLLKKVGSKIQDFNIQELQINHKDQLNLSLLKSQLSFQDNALEALDYIINSLLKKGI